MEVEMARAEHILFYSPCGTHSILFLVRAEHILFFSCGTHSIFSRVEHILFFSCGTHSIFFNCVYISNPNWIESQHKRHHGHFRNDRL
jgi:hypothetical protein